MSIINTISRMTDVLRYPGGMQALRAWRPFSITSFHMLRRIDKLGLNFSVIIDGGANVGQFARAATMTFPEARVICFEPLPEVAQSLRKNLSDRPQVRVVEAALGSVDGKIEFHRNALSVASSALPVHANQVRSFPQVRETGVVEVDLMRLDTALDGEILTSPCLLKLDLQGFEYEALKGGAHTLSQCDYALIELSCKPMYEGEPPLEDILDLMKGNGMRFVRPLMVLEDTDGEIVQMDGLFAKR
jgi:FkbM family methyltransferase